MRDKISITVDDLSQAACCSDENLPDTRLTVNLVHLFRKRAMQIFMAVVPSVTKEDEALFSDSDVRLTFLKLRYSLGGNSRRLRDMGLEKLCITDLREHTSRLQRVFATASFGVAGKRKKHFVMVSGGECEVDGLCLLRCCSCFG